MGSISLHHLNRECVYDERLPPFQIACVRGHLKLAQWMFSLDPRVCGEQHLCVTELLHKTEDGACTVSDIQRDIRRGQDVHKWNESLFRELCHAGNIDAAKWLLSFDKEVDVRACNEEAFRMSCAHGRLAVAKWLLSLGRGINVRACDDWAFRRACTNGHLAVAKWLLSLNTEVRIGARCNEAFVHACRNNHVETVVWLVSQSPELQARFDSNPWMIASDHMRASLEATSARHLLVR